MFERWVDYYEYRFYQYKWDRLSACLPVIHQLLYVADAIEWLGPTFAYSQWTMERVCRMMVKTARNPYTTNRNMEINLLLIEQRIMVPYIRYKLPNNILQDEYNVDGLLDADDDGMVALNEFFCQLLRLVNQSGEISEEPNTILQPTRLFGTKEKIRVRSYQSRLLNNYVQQTETANIGGNLPVHPDMPTQITVRKGCYI